MLPTDAKTRRILPIVPKAWATWTGLCRVATIPNSTITPRLMTFWPEWILANFSQFNLPGGTILPDTACPRVCPEARGGTHAPGAPGSTADGHRAPQATPRA